MTETIGRPATQDQEQERLDAAVDRRWSEDADEEERLRRVAGLTEPTPGAATRTERTPNSLRTIEAAGFE